MKYVQIVTQNEDKSVYTSIDGIESKKLEIVHTCVESRNGRDFRGDYTVIDAEIAERLVFLNMDAKGATTHILGASGKVSLRTYRRLRAALVQYMKEADCPIVETRNGGTWRCTMEG